MTLQVSARAFQKSEVFFMLYIEPDVFLMLYIESDVFFILDIASDVFFVLYNPVLTQEIFIYVVSEAFMNVLRRVGGGRYRVRGTTW